jgi:hypothetical protein
MQNIDFTALLAGMTQAAAVVFKADWPKISDYASHEFQQFAEDSVMIGNMIQSGKITVATGQILLDMHRNSMLSVLTAIEGITLIVVEQAINAALAVLRTTVNTALGFALL